MTSSSRSNISEAINRAVTDRHLGVAELANEHATTFLKAPARFDPSCLAQLGLDGMRHFLSLVGAREVTDAAAKSAPTEPLESADPVGWTQHPKLPPSPHLLAIAAGGTLAVATIAVFGLAIAIL